MADDRHYSEPYHRPHPETRLAFDARGVYHLCRAPRRTIANDPNKRRLFEHDTRKGYADKFPDLPADVIDHMVTLALGLKAASSELDRLRENWDRLAKGDIALEPPQPRRPHTLIIAAKVENLRARNPTAARSDIWNQTAAFFNEGFPATGRLAALDGWSIRSAEKAFSEMKLKEDRTGSLVAKMKRRERFGRPHDWDRNFLDFSRDAEWLQQNTEIFAGSDTPAIIMFMMQEQARKPLEAMDAMYRDAIRNPRFGGLKGEKLADRIDELFGFEKTVDKLLTKQEFRDSGLSESDFIASDAA